MVSIFFNFFEVDKYGGRGVDGGRWIFILLLFSSSLPSSRSTNNETQPFPSQIRSVSSLSLSPPSLFLFRHLQSHKMSASLSSALTTPTATATTPVPVPISLDELVKLLHAELGSNGLDSEGVDVARVQALMTNYVSNEEDWKKYAHFDKGRYTRNLVDDGNGKFNLMILAWPENVGRYCFLKC